MNKSPDSFELDLEREHLLQSGSHPPQDRALAADWHLRNQLRELRDEAGLPPRLRRRVLNARSRRVPAAWLSAVAAALLVAVALPVLRNAPEPTPADAIGAAEMAELGLALSTIHDAGRRAAHLTGRGVSRGLVVPRLGLAELPYADWLQRTFQPVPRTSVLRASGTHPDPDSNPQEKQP